MSTWLTIIKMDNDRGEINQPFGFVFRRSTTEITVVNYLILFIIKRAGSNKVVLNRKQEHFISVIFL